MESHETADSSSPEKRVLEKIFYYYLSDSQCNSLPFYFVCNRDFDSVRVIIQMKLGPGREDFPINSMIKACFGGAKTDDGDDFTMADFIMQYSSQQQRFLAFGEVMNYAIYQMNPSVKKIDFLLNLRAKYDIEVDCNIFVRGRLPLPKQIVYKLLRNGYGKYAHSVLFDCISHLDLSVAIGEPEDDLENFERSKGLIEEFGISLGKHGLDALEHAILANNHLMIAFLIAQGVSINSLDALRIAVESVRGYDDKHIVSYDTMKMLLEHGAYTEKIQVMSLVPYLVRPQDELRLSLLFQYGVQFDYKGLQARVTPRLVKFMLKSDHRAARNPVFISEVFNACCGFEAHICGLRCREILTIMIDAGADFTKFEPITEKKCYKDAIALRFGKLSDFTSSLGKAVAKDDETKFTKLITCSKGVKRKLNDTPNWNALHVAADYGRTEMARKMVSLGADTNIVTPDGLTAFHLAAAAGHSETLLAFTSS